MRADQYDQDSDLWKLNALFTGELRTRQYWARASQEGGLQAVPEPLLLRHGKFVLWHENETPLAFGPDGMLKRPLHMRHFKKYAHEIASVLAGVFGDRITVDESPNGGVVVQPFDLEPLDQAVQFDRNQKYVGRKYFIPTPVAREWYITQISDALVRLVADDAPDIWMQLPLTALTQQIVHGAISEVAA